MDSTIVSQGTGWVTVSWPCTSAAAIPVTIIRPHSIWRSSEEVGGQNYFREVKCNTAPQMHYGHYGSICYQLPFWQLWLRNGFPLWALQRSKDSSEFAATSGQPFSGSTAPLTTPSSAGALSPTTSITGQLQTQGEKCSQQNSLPPGHHCPAGTYRRDRWDLPERLGIGCTARAVHLQISAAERKRGISGSYSRRCRGESAF